jgi:hypothetical protein
VPAPVMKATLPSSLAMARFPVFPATMVAQAAQRQGRPLMPARRRH